MSSRVWALASTAVATGLIMTVGARNFSVGSASTNRIYVPVRKDVEFESLLSLPTPLLANFGFPGDPTSGKISEILRNIVSATDESTPIPLSFVDIECDEPATADLVQRYMIGHFPTVLALHGGAPLSRFVPQKNAEYSQLDADIKKWIATSVVR